MLRAAAVGVGSAQSAVVGGQNRTFEIVEKIFLCVLLSTGERVCQGVEV